MYRKAVLYVAIAFGMIGCSDSSGPTTERSIGVIQPGFPVEVILAPDTVAVSSRFGATVNTFGSSTCTIPDGIELILTENSAFVTPYDRRPTGQAICTGDIAPRPHPVELQFTLAGVATIVVIGYRLTDYGAVLTSVERSIVVRP
jgi:hypothetical protein